MCCGASAPGPAGRPFSTGGAGAGLSLPAPPLPRPRPRRRWRRRLVEPEYAVRYRDLYRRHWWWRARERLILDVLRRLRPGAGWSAILDVGCGDGLFLTARRVRPGGGRGA